MSIINKLSIETIIKNALVVFKVLGAETPEATQVQVLTFPLTIQMGIENQLLKKEQIPSIIARRLIQSRTHRWIKDGELDYSVIRETAVELLDNPVNKKIPEVKSAICDIMQSLPYGIESICMRGFAAFVEYLDKSIARSPATPKEE